MWPWIKRWRDWAMNDLWSMHRSSPQPHALHYSYEKAGLTLHDQPIPWNAEAVLVEALVRLPPGSQRRKADFQLRHGRQEPIAPESMRRDETSSEHHRLVFRMMPPALPVTVELIYKDHHFGQLTLPVLTREEFLKRLRLEMPTLYVRLGNQSVACQTFVASQCRGLLLSTLVSSPTSLVPLLDLGLHVEFRSERASTSYTAPATLSSSQLAGNQALITLMPRRFPRRMGSWLATWIVGDRPLVKQQIQAISQSHFRHSLRVCDTRFVIQRDKEGVYLTRHMPPLAGVARVGPCFLLSSKEPGMAGLCPLQVRTQVPGSVRPPLLVEEELLVTDGPTMFAPGTVDAADLDQVSAFELRTKGSSLGTMPLSPVPAAFFTAEGGFRTTFDFPWSGAADEELTDRLSRLVDGGSNAG
ncbi:MAG TPA: hypothetical protein VG099_29795 [Gemmataceae bacterium]|jgi:hypothetical protein|nr:hypothetical protein [Gemmataceae bacterium]